MIELLTSFCTRAVESVASAVSQHLSANTGTEDEKNAAANELAARYYVRIRSGENARGRATRRSRVPIPPEPDELIKTLASSVEELLDAGQSVWVELIGPSHSVEDSCPFTPAPETLSPQSAKMVSDATMAMALVESNRDMRFLVGELMQRFNASNQARDKLLVEAVTARAQLEAQAGDGAALGAAAEAFAPMAGAIILKLLSNQGTFPQEPGSSPAEQLDQAGAEEEVSRLWPRLLDLLGAHPSCLTGSPERMMQVNALLQAQGLKVVPA